MYKTAIPLLYLLTVDVTVSSGPMQGKFALWKKSVGEQIRNAWRRLSDMWPSGVSLFISPAETMSCRVRKISQRIKFPAFQKLCANLGKDTVVREHVESNQGGVSVWKIFKGLFKKMIPVEFHLPGYKYCGPNTDLKRRLLRGDRGINKLDDACMEHDLGYIKHPDLGSRIAIDRDLAWKAYARMKADDASFGEKTAARVVVTAMCVKLQVTTKVKPLLQCNL